ncbi:MAG: GvpL/GvpF family gas vesicle protein [Mariniphaga sp.]
MEAAKDKEGIYLYCIIRNSRAIDFGPMGIGNRADMVYTINFKDISMVVSKSGSMRYEARRVNLTAHQLVLEEVMKQFSILPIRFSTISGSYDESKILTILEKEYDKFSDLLDKMNGKKELGLKVMAIEEPIFKYILEKYDDIRLLKEKLAKLDPDKAHYQLMKIGEMVEKALVKENSSFSDNIISMLTPLSEEVKINDKFGERMILNAAFLIKDENESEFDKAILAFDSQYGNLLSFKYVGSLPPYNFVNLVINTLEA